MSLTLFSLDGKVALITGGNGGLGRAVALGFKEAGADVVGTGRNEAKNQAVAAESDFVTGVALPVDGGYAVADRLMPE